MMSELDQPPSHALLAIDEASEAQRAARVEQDAGFRCSRTSTVFNDLLFTTLWLRTPCAAALRHDLTSDDLREIDAAASKIVVQGARYPEELEKMTYR
jgi:hypothetical protein